MQWTKDVPTVPGWYWIRFRGPGENPEVVRILRKGDPLVVWEIGYEDCENLDDARFYQGAEWCGPLPVPTEAT